MDTCGLVVCNLISEHLVEIHVGVVVYKLN